MQPDTILKYTSKAGYAEVANMVYKGAFSISASFLPAKETSSTTKTKSRSLLRLQYPELDYSLDFVFQYYKKEAVFYLDFDVFETGSQNAEICFGENSKFHPVSNLSLCTVAVEHPKNSRCIQKAGEKYIFTLTLRIPEPSHGMSSRRLVEMSLDLESPITPLTSGKERDWDSRLASRRTPSELLTRRARTNITCPNGLQISV